MATYDHTLVRNLGPGSFWDNLARGENFMGKNGTKHSGQDGKLVTHSHLRSSKCDPRHLETTWKSMFRGSKQFEDDRCENQRNRKSTEFHMPRSLRNRLLRFLWPPWPALYTFEHLSIWQCLDHETPTCFFFGIHLGFLLGFWCACVRLWWL